MRLWKIVALVDEVPRDVAVHKAPRRRCDEKFERVDEGRLFRDGSGDDVADREPLTNPDELAVV